MTDRDQIIAALSNKLPAARQELVLEFADRFWERVPDDEITELSVDVATGATLSCWQHIEQHAARDSSILIRNPDFEQDGWDTSHTIVEIVHPDMPFIADSILMELAGHNTVTHRMQNVVLPIQRDGQLIVGFGGDQAERECLIYAEIDRIPTEEFGALRERLSEVLQDVRACVEDFSAMKTRMAERVETLTSHPPPLPQDEVDEGVEFLQWLANDSFTFLGYREFVFESGVIRQVAGSELGVMRRRPLARDKRIDEQTGSVREFLLERTLLSFSKSGTRSRVHRPAYPDYVAVKRFSPDGEVIGEYGFWGLYTSPVYTEAPQRIPILRRKVAAIMRRSGLEPGGFDAKNLQQAINTHPRDELFQGTEDELFHALMQIAAIHERRQIRTFIRRDRYGMFFVCLVFIPREQYNTRVRLGIERILLEATGASDSEFNTSFSESILVRVHFILRVDPGHEIDIDADAVQADIIALTRDWASDFSELLHQHYGEAVAGQLARRYLDAFPVSYREGFPVRLAVYDVGHMERLSPERPLVMRFSRPPEDELHTVHLKLYHNGGPLPLSDVVPTLENLGLRVLDGAPYYLECGDGHEVTIHDFHLSSGATLDLHEIGARFEEAFVRIWYGQADDDRFNRLVIAAELDWREVMLLRAYARYMKQIRFPFAMEFIADTLVRHADLTEALIQLFQARFNPEHGPVDPGGDPSDSMVAQLTASMDDIALLNEDRIMRRLLELILATLRTNFFQREAGGAPKDYLSLKFDPSRISDLPPPRPAFEVFVHSNSVEGVHLRNGKIARGGLRWSDRAEDFRTEVLGLVKAQVVKNSVIVPTGAKGGFIVRKPPEERQALMNTAVTCYQRFISGLLDITDNTVEGQIRPPADVRRWDGDDPYLVVAADKGTATFSDIANDISNSRGFWLGDAFASGGSNGYDHKKMGITARGAWISVQRHFGERGIDVQSDRVSVVGIGDMSGDVFGNGMLLSHSLRLVAAFNHLHIFIDPEPDIEAAFRERERLFALPRSNWSDYDTELISAGGGVFARSLKSIEITPQMQALFDIEQTRLSADELINRLLRARVDLIWNGGIGTYVKASWQSHGDADDRANDGLRVDAKQLRAQVFGEGGNLGMTQQARVEFDLCGGAVNTDFIDNSAGVDCSDHEVNIKILLNAAVSAGDLTLKQRNTLLEDMTESVSELVLTNNFRQAQALSLASLHARSRLGEYQRFIGVMEHEQRFSRTLEGIPDDEHLTERAQDGGRAFTRPEMAVLISYAKIHLKERLLESTIHEDVAIGRTLSERLPRLLRERFPEEIPRHPLAREIIATQLANDVVHHMGPTFVTHLREFVGGETADVVRAFYIAADCYDIRGRFRAIEELAVAESERLAMMLSLIQVGRRASRWFLRHRRAELDVASCSKRYRPDVAALMQRHEFLLGSVARERWQAESERLTALGVSEDFAGQIAAAPAAAFALPIIAAAERVSMDCTATAGVYAAIGGELSIDWLGEQLIGITPGNPWEAMERDALIDDLATQQSELTVSVAKSAPGAADDKLHSVTEWLAANPTFANAWRSVIDNAKRAPSPSFAMFSMTCRKLVDLTKMVA